MFSFALSLCWCGCVSHAMHDARVYAKANNGQLVLGNVPFTLARCKSGKAIPLPQTSATFPRTCFA